MGDQGGVSQGCLFACSTDTTLDLISYNLPNVDVDTPEDTVEEGGPLDSYVWHMGAWLGVGMSESY